MTETQLLAKLLKDLRARVGTQGVVFKHQDAKTTGVPDFSLTMNGLTSWWEAKKLDKSGRIKGTELQRQRMRELALAGAAWYIVWSDEGVGIVRPSWTRSDGTCVADFYTHRRESTVQMILDRHRIAAFAECGSCAASREKLK